MALGHPSPRVGDKVRVVQLIPGELPPVGDCLRTVGEVGSIYKWYHSEAEGRGTNGWTLEVDFPGIGRFVYLPDELEVVEG